MKTAHLRAPIILVLFFAGACGGELGNPENHGAAEGTDTLKRGVLGVSTTCLPSAKALCSGSTVGSSPSASPGPSKFIFAFGQRIAKVNNYGVEYLFSDQVGSHSLVSDQNGNYKTHEEYLPFGERLAGTIYQHGYNGKEWDQQTGMNYFGARFYDPEVGRFMQRDTVDDGPNPFGYVRNNPLIGRDPTGHVAIVGMDVYQESLEAALAKGGTEAQFQHWFQGQFSALGETDIRLVSNETEFLTALSEVDNRVAIMLHGAPNGDIGLNGVKVISADELAVALRFSGVDTYYDLGCFGAVRAEAASAAGIRVTSGWEGPAFKGPGKNIGLAVDHLGPRLNGVEPLAVRIEIPGVSDYLSDEGLKTGAIRIFKNVGEKTLKAIPVAGIFVGLSSAYANAAEGNYGMAAVDAVGTFADPVDWAAMAGESMVNAIVDMNVVAKETMHRNPWMR